MHHLNFNLRHLRGFVNTYELGSLVAAAQSVNMSQPAISQAIIRLENQIGLSLFDRQSDGMSPTAVADLIYPRFFEALRRIRSKKITNAQARAFVALAQGGNYAEASALTGLAPPSLHRAVSDLESGLGQQLTERRGRALVLTKQGRTLGRRLRLAQAELEAGVQELATHKGESAGRICIGAMPLCRARLLPESIVNYQKNMLIHEVDFHLG